MGQCCVTSRGGLIPAPDYQSQSERDIMTEIARSMEEAMPHKSSKKSYPPMKGHPGKPSKKGKK